MSRRTDFGTGLVVCWSQQCNSVPRNACLDLVEIFAIDLLHAELRLRRCDVEEFVTFDFDSDGNFVALLFPALLQVVDKVERQSDFVHLVLMGKWKNLKVRCYWLIASWYFWRGRYSSNVRESRDAEEEGIRWIESMKSCLQGTECVSTPHLSSPRRKGRHWKELSLASLSLLSDEIQASAVVLLAQEQFLDVTSKFHDEADFRVLQQEDCDALLNIGEALLQRYTCTVDDSSSKIFEIVDDFINCHGETLSSLSVRAKQSFNAVQNWFDDLVQSGKVESGVRYKFSTSPCILSILVTCLRTKQDHCLSTVLLLSSLVATLIELSENILSRKKLQSDRKIRFEVSDDVSSVYDSDNDDDLSSVVEDGTRSNGKQKLSADDLKLQLYSSMIHLLLQWLLSFCRDSMTGEQCYSFAQSDVFASVLTRTLTFTTEVFRYSHPIENQPDSADDDLGSFLAVQGLFKFLVSERNDGATWQLEIMRSYIHGIFHIVIVQRQILSGLSRLKPNKNGRNLRLKATRKRADLVAAACYDVGILLSKNLAQLQSGQIERSVLFGEICSKSWLSMTLAPFCDSLLWFWKASSDKYMNVISDKSSLDEPHLSSYLDGFGRERLRVPVAVAIVGLCGSAPSVSPFMTNLSRDVISLTEFYDSDVSTTEWMSTSDVGEEFDNGSKEGNLRVIVHAVHCINQVFGNVDEKEACSFAYVENYISNHGPGLPLVVARVLNFFANVLLVEFEEKENDTKKNIWSDYSYGTRTTGGLLDSILWKAYKCLHGFTLTSDSKESAASTSGTVGSSKQVRTFLPENKESAAMLYRCTMRAYSHGRRSPPKAALETVLAALPEKKKSIKTLAIRNFIFSTQFNEEEMDGLITLASEHTDCDATFSRIKDFDWLSTGEEGICEDETSVVRRGLSRLIAHGPIPRIQDSGDEKDWRASSTQSEEELSTKFNAIIDDLCFGNTKDWEGWFKASQCLNMKSDLIADRLGLATGFTRSQKFYVPEHRGLPKPSVSLADLLSLQDHEQRINETGSVKTLGGDLSLYVRYYWSSLDSLNLFFQEVGLLYGKSSENRFTQSNDDSSSARVWREIWSYYEKKDCARWQHAIGGLFVSSLRIVAYRCLSVALYLSKRVDNTENKLLKAELVETLGVNLYVELIGSQTYGYPMKEMTACQKRNLATASALCFEQAIKLVQSEEDSSSRLEAWDLLFMKGKVCIC
jgi:hypothetical protein